jgi:hypothetical protein
VSLKISYVIIFIQPSGESDNVCWQQTPSSFMTMQGPILLTLSKISFAAGNGILEHPAYSPDMRLCNYDLFTRMKEPPRGTRYNTREEIIHAVGRSLLDINRSGCADGVQCLPQIWQRAVRMGGDYIEGMCVYLR